MAKRRMSVAQAEREIKQENQDRVDSHAAYYESEEYKEVQRRTHLPSSHPDHICGIFCDGQDGSNSHCARLRAKLFGE